MKYVVVVIVFLNKKLDLLLKEFRSPSELFFFSRNKVSEINKMIKELVESCTKVGIHINLFDISENNFLENNYVEFWDHNT